MRHHNPKRFVITAVAFAAVAGTALLPGVASADGGPKPRPQGPAANGIWVPQGSPILGTTYGGDGQTSVVEREQHNIRQPLGRAPTRIVDAADYVI
jgi:hypothetical protein